MSSGSPIGDYYDSNTHRFLLVGRSGDRHAIHRELWGPGVQNPRQAAGYVNNLVAEEIEASLPPPDRTGPRRSATQASGRGPIILDMGCGVGGTLFELAERFPRARLHGVTISRRQHQLALRLKTRLDRGDRCDFSLADFQSMKLDLRADFVVGIESFVHSIAPERFFASVEAHLAPGGRMILVDDFLARAARSFSSRDRAEIERFRVGWHARSMCTVETCATAAKQAGLDLLEDRDLTGLVRPGRIRDRVIARLSPIFVALGLIRHPFFANMIGGNALQVGLVNGFIEYRMLVFASGRGGD
ncbi:MAG: class I SAM-dependent methyltransferase [Gemmatimonadota bacterium]